VDGVSGFYVKTTAPAYDTTHAITTVGSNKYFLYFTFA